MIKVIKKVIKLLSGQADLEESRQMLFNKVIGFKGLAGGVGVSTLVQNVAVALSVQTKLKVCVVDTHMENPMQKELLSKGIEGKREDILSYKTNIQELLIPTHYKNVSVVEYTDRTLLQIIGEQESGIQMRRVVDHLKKYFDVILLDLTNEPTEMGAYAGVLCNVVYLVGDTSLRCTRHLREELIKNRALGIGSKKIKGVIVNKSKEKGEKTYKAVGLEVEGVIPFSQYIKEQEETGVCLYTVVSKEKEVSKYNAVTDEIVRGIVEETEISIKYSREVDEIGAELHRLQKQGIESNNEKEEYAYEEETEEEQEEEQEEERGEGTGC